MQLQDEAGLTEKSHALLSTFVLTESLFSPEKCFFFVVVVMGYFGSKLSSSALLI